MTGNERRKAILENLSNESAISGTKLAEKLGVSRQIVVQDIALLRAEGAEIFSTHMGYVLTSQKPIGFQREFCVHHTNEQLLDELLCIIDLGGQILDVSVDHEVYGKIRGNLTITTKEEAEQFAGKLQSSGAPPLKSLTNDYHYHTISAPSERLLDYIWVELLRRGYLVRDV